MPHFLPFRGVHYDVARADLALTTSPPYDVLDADERAALAATHPANAVVIDLPVDGDDPYAEAGATLRRWLADGTLVQDDAESFYVYRMESTDEAGHRRATTGVFGALELSRPGEGGILPHELTTPKAKSDRLNLLRGARANLSAVWALSPAAGLSKLLDMDEPPLAQWVSDDGVGHTLWAVTDPERLTAIIDAVGANPVVIADGHHRYETSLAYRDEQRAAGADPDAPSESALVYVVELVDEELNVLPIHRLLAGLPDGYDLVGALEASFVVAPGRPDRRRHRGGDAGPRRVGARHHRRRLVPRAPARDGGGRPRPRFEPARRCPRRASGPRADLPARSRPGAGQGRLR